MLVTFFFPWYFSFYSLSIAIEINIVELDCSKDMNEFQDENRYNAGRGAHINLKRAERARITVTKIPGMVSSKHMCYCEYHLDL